MKFSCLADETANPRLIALDMISQAEHGKDSVAGLVTTSKELADKVLEYLRKTVTRIERNEIVSDALSRYGFIILCENIDEMIANANVFAPEHIEIVARNSKEIADRIVSAGLISDWSLQPGVLERLWRWNKPRLAHRGVRTRLFRFVSPRLLEKS